MEEFRRLERELVYKGKIVDFYKDTIRVPNGNIVDWDFIGHQGAAAVLPVREDGKLIMVRQYRNAIDRYTLELPAGGLNAPDEPTEQAAIRELREETGYTAGRWELLVSIYTTVAFCNEKIDIYLARDLKLGERHLDEDEDINVEAYDIENLCDMIYSGTIQDSKTVAAVLAYKDKYC